MKINHQPKKVLALLLVLSLILIATACGAQEEPAPTPEPSPESAETEVETGDIDWPNRPITVVVPFAAGGGSDRLVRTLAPYLGSELGVEVLTENREGAGSQIGLTVVRDATPDGHVLGQANQPATSFTILFQNAAYTVEDFAWLNFHHIDPIQLVALNEAPWNDMAELIADIEANPGTIAIGCNQMSGPHIYLEYLKDELDLNFIIVPYDGGGAGRAGLVGGHVDAYFANVFANVPLLDQAKGLATGWDERSELWPDTPTVSELFPDQPQLSEMAMPLATFRGITVQRAFKDNNPDEFDKLVEAYETAFHSEGHMADSDTVGQTPIMHWIGPEAAEELARDSHEIVQTYQFLFE